MKLPPNSLTSKTGAWLLTGLMLLAGTSARAQWAGPPTGKRPAELENFDARDSASASAATTRAGYLAARAGSANPALVATPTGNKAARAALVRSVPALIVEDSRFEGGLPEVVGTGSAGSFLTAPSADAPEVVMRGFLADHAALYGLQTGEVAGLVKFADYANPAGNLSWVGLRQELNGIPVFQGEILAALTGAGALARTTGNLASGLDPARLATAPAMTPVAATVSAAAGIGRKLNTARMTLNSTEQAGRVSYVGGGPFARETKTELTYFPLAPGVATLAYSMVLWDQPRAYLVLVDAADGTLLFRKCITQDQSQSVTYNVYNADSPSPLSPTTVLPGQGTQPAGIARVDVTLVADDLNASPLGWITDSAAGATVTTTGNNCDAGLDAVAPDGIDANSRPTTTTRAFSYAYNPPPLGSDAPTTAAYCNGVITNLFFWTNRYHDRLYELGFTEAARNFQTTNTFTINGTATNRGGAGGDAVSAQVHDYSGTNNANFSTPPDGSPGRMQMYLFNSVTPNRDGSLDADVFLHEMTHGLSNRLHANGGGLAANQSGGMGEGWSDFYARCLLASTDENVDGVYASGGYVTYKLSATFTDNYYYGIRRFPYASISNVGANGKPHNPETFADVDPAQISLADGAYPPSPIVGGGGATEVHNIGEVWCSMLLEVRARILKRLGFAAGNTRTLQIVTDAMKLDVASPNMVQARDAIIAADNAGYGGADVADIRAGFALRGMGAGASTNGTNVVESFSPNLSLGNVTVSDTLGNGNGVPEPGEDLLITVPLTNIGGNAEPNATVVVGTYTAAYNLPANGGSAVRTIPYRVPANTPLGSTLQVPLTYQGAGGGGKSAIVLPIGSPAYGFTETFDGVTAPALPAGWTTSTAITTGGIAGKPWVTVAGPVVDAGNNVYSPDLAGNGTAGGEASLFSPSIAVPATGSPRLSFKHTYGFEQSGGANWDGGVLEISVAGGAYTDIVTAGGTFAQNGYNGTTVNQTQNPIGNRPAFCGSSGGALTTIVTLPVGARGQNVQFRWRLGFDDSVAGPNGWSVDTVRLITGYTAAPIDTDGDGLQDGYERAHGLDPNDSSDAALDADGDGISNLQEYLAGTDPQNPASALKVLATSTDPAAGTTITFPSVNGKVYALEYKNSLTDTAWITVKGTLIGTDAPMQFTDATSVGQAQRFYRVRVVGP